MGGFFEFIFANFFIVIIIVAAIINFFNKANKQEKKQERRRQVPKRQHIPDVRKENIPRAERTVQQAQKQIDRTKESVTKSVDEQRQEQFDRLRRQYQTVADDKEHVEQKSRRSNMERQHAYQEQVDVKLEDRFTAKGLIEGVIMAEVLGPPRGLKPYKNIVSQRKQ
ncbi:MAG TPA: hypothetical protein VK085_12245 [Pseudogracilibacillus sp.]|nr:hypothetical protein [Pseudogracilibacillus sp.]